MNLHPTGCAGKTGHAKPLSGTKRRALCDLPTRWRRSKLHPASLLAKPGHRPSFGPAHAGCVLGIALCAHLFASLPARPATSTVLLAPARAKAAHDLRNMNLAASIATPATARPVLTPSVEFGGLPVIYAGSGDGSWPDQMEPNDGDDDTLGPAPVEVGILYRSLNLLPRTAQHEFGQNPLAGEDRDWYIWSVSAGRCYRAFTGDTGGSARQKTGAGKIQHALRIWWDPPVREGHALLAEYRPETGPAEGGYFASALACAGADGRMAAEVYNYKYPLKDPAGSTYTFGVLDAGYPAPPPPTREVPAEAAPIAPQRAAQSSPPAPLAAAPPASAAPALTPVYQPTPAPQPALPPDPTAPPTAPGSSPGRAGPSTSTTSTVSTSTPAPASTPTALPASVDVVAYLDRNRNSAPDPGEGLQTLRVVLLDVRTNSAQQTATTNANGYAHIEWRWSGRVRISLPDLNWSDLVDPYDMASTSAPRADVWSRADDGGLYLEVRVVPAPLPAVIP